MNRFSAAQGSQFGENENFLYLAAAAIFFFCGRRINRGTCQSWIR